ncbi:hypothetical protein GCM10010168_26200 [Actinoplanes ianthinogenes]|uniref:Uncharacterized protein n=1 Tax=Actinoplanes ianthinogenes TaxID=122358 RepID=A0ABM7M9H3_9ACTN|nr:hypothetical protein [Actinoplanes ianthinogenes]BCJ48260.1 hypothetical protein Aiant_89170 [Actinoplanes ianthinogenes]GGR07507.1 hypothetical protein GCM10010168_26200 [Actinoplanes ianthinogenes]
MGYRPRDRAQATELTLELLATGRVRGVAPGHRPAELEQRIGPPGDEGILDFSGNLLRDWGLLEAYYEREHRGAPWHGTLLMGQLHRMPKPLKWRPIAHELRRLGYQIVPEPQPGLEDRYFRVAESGSQAVVNGRDTGRRWPRGHLAKISAADWLALGGPFDRAAFHAVHRSVYAAVVNQATRRSKPGAEWFRMAHAAVHTVAGEHPSYADEAAAFHDWLLGQEAPVPEIELALMVARCAADTPLGRPSPDRLIRRCLAVLPLTREAARALPTAWRELTPADVRRSKLTRALLAAANQLATPDIPAGLRAELSGWADVLPRLC